MVNAATVLATSKPDARRARPFLKWVGGKTGLLPTILPHFPEKFGTYYEPFLGAGAMFFALADGSYFKNAFLSDTNTELITAFQTLTDCSAVPNLIDTLKMLPYDRNVFEKIRSVHSETLLPLARTARMIYLNRCGFNGLYRVNKAGEFNVPFGRYTNPKICDEENLRAVHQVLAGLHRKSALGIAAGGFELAGQAQPGDVVYFDPPYVPVSKTANFTGYSAGGFKHEDQVRLRDFFGDLARSGVKVILSNSDCDVTRHLYRDFTVHSVLARRNVNREGNRRGPVGEILVVAN